MFSNNNVKIGVAPINWSNDDLPELGGHIPFETCINEMQEAGFSGCEVGIKFPRDPYVLKEILMQRNLQVCNQWMSFTFTTDSFETVKEKFIKLLNFLKILGANIVGGGEVGTSIQGLDKPLYKAKPYNTREQWNALSTGLNELGKIARDEYDISLCYHPHLGTCVQTMSEVEQLLDSTDPDAVFINYDCGHMYATYEDPLKCLKKMGSRVRHVHLKDVRNAVLNEVRNNDLSFLDGIKKGLFTIPGDGDIDTLPHIIEKLDNLHYKGWIVIEAEQDPNMAPPLEYAKRSREYIRHYVGF